MSRPTVLLVESDALARMPLADDLRDYGFDIVEAATGREALAVIHAGLSAVITARRLPGLVDGVTLARTVARSLPAIPVLMLTDERPDDATPIAGHFPTPVDARAVCRLLARLL